MAKEASLEFRLRKIDETRNYLLDEIKHNDLIEHLLILASTVTGYVLISTFAVEIKICAITAGIKKYMSIIKKNKKKHDKVV